MLNGAFGVGKTTVANLLRDVLPHSMIFDPEQVGFVVRKIPARLRTPTERTDDFQDIGAWRTLTITTAGVLRRVSRRALIVPMTLAHEPYFREIRAGFAAIDPDLHHFCLTASLETIHVRLRQRGDPPGAWPYQQTARCVRAFQSPEFREHIDAELHDAPKIVELILKRIG